MSAKLQIVRPVEALDPVAALREERAEVVAALGDVGHKLGRLAEADRAASDAAANIVALGEQEVEAVKVWVAANCEGPQPTPDAEARRKLSDHLASAIAGREAAKVAAAEVSAAGDALRVKLAEIDGRLRVLAIGELSATFAGLADEWAHRSGSIREELARLQALPGAMVEAGRMIFDRGGDGSVERARELYAAAERMRASPIASPAPTPEEVEIAARHWSTKIDALLAGG